jgi:hypothetical protein
MSDGISLSLKALLRDKSIPPASPRRPASRCNRTRAFAPADAEPRRVQVLVEAARSRPRERGDLAPLHSDTGDMRGDNRVLGFPAGITFSLRNSDDDP